MITMIKEQVKELISGFWNYRDLTYTERQVFIRKVFTVPFFALFPLFLTAGLLSRGLRMLAATTREPQRLW